MNTKIIFKKGFTIIELLLVLGIMSILTTILLNSFVSFGREQGLSKDASLVIEVLRQAQSNTLNSKNSNQFGVHFSTNSLILFTGSVYSPGASTNEIYNFNADIRLSSAVLNGGGVDVVFAKLSGGTDNDGTITLVSQSTGATKVIRVYKTGLIE